MVELNEEERKLINKFGSSSVTKIKGLPNFKTFKSGMMYSHRDFDKYLIDLKKKKKCAIVSGFNPSGSMHLGHLPVFETNLFFQKKYGVHVFIPISDDESYVLKKVKDQKEGLENSYEIAKDLFALGFKPSKTTFIIDQECTQIYNLAIRLSRGLTLSKAKSTYGFNNDSNIGIVFYPAVQSAHVLLPQTIGYDSCLVPIGIDEDIHLRTARYLAPMFGIKKCAVIHSKYMLGLDGRKMAKSRPQDAIFLKDNPKEAAKKCMRAKTGGRETLEEQKNKGGQPDKCIVFEYLKILFEDEKKNNKRYKDCRSGKLTCKQCKQILSRDVEKYLSSFQKKRNKIKKSDIKRCLFQ